MMISNIQAKYPWRGAGQRDAAACHSISHLTAQVHVWGGFIFLIIFYREICTFTYFFKIGAGGTAQLVGPSPSSTKSTLQDSFSLTAQIIFHKLTNIPIINPTSSSTFPDKPLFCQSLSITKLESLFKYRGASLSSTPSQFTERGLFSIVH